MARSLWQCTATDPEVLAVAASLELSWPYPLPSLPEDRRLAAALVDEQVRELELARGKPAPTARGAEISFAVLSVVESQPRVALYFLDSEGARVGWVGVYDGREGSVALEKVSLTGIHDFCVGSDDQIVAALMTEIESFMRASGKSIANATSALLIDNRHRDRFRFFDADSHVVHEITGSASAGEPASRAWDEGTHVMLAADIARTQTSTEHEREG